MLGRHFVPNSPWPRGAAPGTTRRSARGNMGGCSRFLKVLGSPPLFSAGRRILCEVALREPHSGATRRQNEGVRSQSDRPEKTFVAAQGGITPRQQFAFDTPRPRRGAPQAPRWRRAGLWLHPTMDSAAPPATTSGRGIGWLKLAGGNNVVPADCARHPPRPRRGRPRAPQHEASATEGDVDRFSIGFEKPTDASGGTVITRLCVCQRTRNWTARLHVTDGVEADRDTAERTGWSETPGKKERER